MGVLACIVDFACAFVYDRWKDIGTIAHNKAAITVEITSRDDTIIFHMVSVVSAGSPARHTPTQKHFLQTPRRKENIRGRFRLHFQQNRLAALLEIVNAFF